MCNTLFNSEFTLPQIFFCAVKLLVNRIEKFLMRVLVCFTDKQESRITMRSKCHTAKRCRIYEVIKAGLGIFCYFYEGSDTVKY